MLASSSSQIRKRKDRADSPSSSNDTASVPAPVKTVQATNGTKGVNGNGVAALKASNTADDLITGQTVLNGKSVTSKTQIMIQTEVRSFDCVKHVRPAEFPEALGALPFPGELRGMVAWTDAFVERLGWMALLAEQVRVLCPSSEPSLMLTLTNHRMPLKRSSPIAKPKRRKSVFVVLIRVCRPRYMISLMTIAI